MSYTTTKRIKQIRQKQNNSFSGGIPLGTDGKLVDMFSGLDLEEQLRLGGKSTVSINETEQRVQIIERHYAKDSENNIPTFTIRTLIDNLIFYALIDNHNDIDYIIDSNGNNIGLYQEIMDTPVIYIELYKGNYDESSSNNELLHTKEVHINTESISETIIREELT